MKDNALTDHERTRQTIEHASKLQEQVLWGRLMLQHAMTRAQALRAASAARRNAGSGGGGRGVRGAGAADEVAGVR